MEFVLSSNIKIDIHFEWMKNIQKNIIGRENIVMSVRYYSDKIKIVTKCISCGEEYLFSIHPSAGNNSMLFM